ncbi:hypothetical protein BCR42DRAFT_422645 [Absidia repens]|uniref:SAP domain-containing protein n=1 Tax=Absidia repens TaxID=90262 RepID=A0A1X2I8F6_9FUNG|nr:hypothetical protein BCR42DRAFT_422645 [Absidia repens]
MYYFDNNNNKDEPSPSPTSNNGNLNNDYNPLYSQSFNPSSFHQHSHSLDDNFSFLNFDNNAAPPTFLQDSAVTSLGHDSLLAQNWNSMYDSSFVGDSQQRGQLFLPLQQQQQQQQQHDSHQKQPPSPGENSDLFLSLTDEEQQAILMTEPNFLRQQYLLHDNRMKMEMEEHDERQTRDHRDSPPIRSNLSAMFGQSTSAANNHSAISASLSSSIPSHSAISANSSNDILQSSHQPPSMSQPVEFANGQQQQQMQVYPNSISGTYPTTVKRASSSNTKPRKEINRRSQQGIGSRGNNRANPIPINAGSSSTSGAVTKHSSSVPTEIDHQRRFNELQARFRVNYARKSTTAGNGSTSSSQHHHHSIPSSSFSGVSSGFGNRTSRDYMTGNNGVAVFGSSVPTSMEKRLMESVYGDANEFENEASQVSNKKSQSTTSTTSGVAIPKKSNSSSNPGPSSSSSMKQTSSFPSRTMPIQIQRVHRVNTNQPVDAEQLQKRLDDQLVKANFDDITVSELKEMLRQRGKPATGKKAILLQRLVDERDNINAGRSGKATHRYSQPPPSLEKRNSMEAMYSSPLLESPSSVPNSSMFLSSSPGSTTLSLNRSIANMHIGSPPMSSSSQQHIRRFSPYNAPTGSSPRLGPSPKMQIQKQTYSSSMPNNYPSSSPNNNTNNSNNSNEMMIPSSSYNDGYSPMSPSVNSIPTTRNTRPYQGWAGRQKSYAPFTSSTLATPDRDNDKDPFDAITQNTMNINVHQQQQQPLYDSLYQAQQDHRGIKEEAMEWMTHSSTENSSLNGILQDLPEGVSIDQFISWLNENDQFNVNMDPMKVDMAGIIPIDANYASYSDGPLYDDLPGDPDHTT